ncbi:MAG: DUF1861 family protein [Herbinix sp.]|nr:DUF1861 family protein [Herbinix sp.]
MAIHLIEDLLYIYRKGSHAKNPEKIVFHNVSGYDVYNPTATFSYKGKTVICARVEKRESEHSEAIFFYEKEVNQFYPLEGIKGYKLQDPFITKVGDYYVFGGTETFPHPENEHALWWHTKFFYGKELSELENLTTGPKGMKDIRVVELQDGRIGVFSRPQGIVGGRGKIGFTIINRIEELNEEIISAAPLLELFDDEEWGGVNEAICLKDGRIGVLGHIAKFTPEDLRHYYSMSFILDPITKELTDVKIIAERADFLLGPAKRSDLVDVLFSGGILLKEDKAELFVGVSDCEVQKIQINNPFLS